MNDNWEVELRINGDIVLTIGSSGLLSGIENIDEHADAVRAAAECLDAFIGQKEASACFYCGGDWMIETDNNGPIGKCPVCSPAP